MNTVTIGVATLAALPYMLFPLILPVLTVIVTLVQTEKLRKTARVSGNVTREC